MEKVKMITKRILSFFVCAALILTYMPVTAARAVEEFPIEDMYFVLNDVRQTSNGFTVTDGASVEIWVDLDESLTDVTSVYASIVSIHADMTPGLYSMMLTYDADDGIYKSDFGGIDVDGCEVYVNRIGYEQSGSQDEFVYRDKTGKLISFMHFFGQGTTHGQKSIALNFQITDGNTRVTADSDRITTFNKLGVSLPDTDRYPGITFLGWQMGDGQFIADGDTPFIAYNDYDIYDDVVELYFEAVYDKQLIKIYYSYMDENGNPVPQYIYYAIEKNSEITFGELLDSLIDENLLPETCDWGGYKFAGWVLEDLPYDMVVEPDMSNININAKYSIDGIVIGGKLVKDGQYIDNNLTISSEKPEGGYAYFKDRKVTLNNFCYDGDGYSPDYISAGLYTSGDLEIAFEGRNKIYSAEHDGIKVDDGDLTINGKGFLDIYAGDETDGIDVEDGNLIIKNGNLAVEGTDHGVEVDNGGLVINDGNIYVKGGDEGLDAEYNVEINGGTIKINASDIGIDAGFDCIITGGDITIYAENDDGIEADYDVSVTGGNISIYADEFGIETYMGSVTFADCYVSIISTSGAVMASESIDFGSGMKKYYVEEIDGCYEIVEFGATACIIELEPVSFDNKTLTDEFVMMGSEKVGYIGEAVELPEIVVLDPGTSEPLTEGEDYEVEIIPGEIKEMGKYFVIVRGIGDYNGEVLNVLTVYDADIYVGDTIMSLGDYLANGSDTVTDKAPENGGYAYYNYDGVLELHDFEYEGKGYYNEEYDYYNPVIYTDNELVIDFSGDNVLTNTLEYGDCISAYSDLLIDGSGSLELNGDFGIRSYKSDIIILDGTYDINTFYDGINSEGSVYVYRGTVDIAMTSCGIYAEEFIDIADAKITINDTEEDTRNGENYSYGLATEINNVKIYEDSIVEINAECGIYSYEGEIAINDGNISITAEYGIWAELYDFYMSGGKLDIKADYGIYSDSYFDVSGGVITIDSTEFAASCGFAMSLYDVTIIVPEDGYIDDKYSEETGNYDSFILDADGNIAKKVKLATVFPIISGVKDGELYCVTQSVTVTDENDDLVSVTVNGDEVDDISAPIKLEGNKECYYDIVATDAEGNETVVRIIMCPLELLVPATSSLEKETVTSDDVPYIGYEKAALTELDTENATDDEKKIVEDLIKKCNELLEAADAAAVAKDTVNTNAVKDITSENVTAQDKLNLENALADIEKAIVDYKGNYTEDEMAELEADKERIEDALQALNAADSGGNNDGGNDSDKDNNTEHNPDMDDSSVVTTMLTVMAGAMAVFTAMVFITNRKRETEK